ncbi:MAG: ABC transporter ATP-binding protein [Alistipes sp.]|nr:ABC transporter ATP-binding protein [Alistipes sp.]
MSHHFVRFENVHYTYPNGYEALRGVSFCVTHGQKVALVGTNGAGKSTLLLHINGLLLPTKGSVVVGGVPVERKTLPLVRQSVGLVFQNPDDQLFMPTVEEDVAFGPSNMGLPAVEIERRVEEALGAVGALALRQRAPYHLSGGQKKSVSIATVLSMEPAVLVLDEPTSNLDPQARRAIIRLIRTFSHTCLMATHDMEMVWELCERTLVMREGELVADGSTTSIFEDEALLERCGLEPPYALWRESHETQEEGAECFAEALSAETR